VLNLNNGMYIT